MNKDFSLLEWEKLIEKLLPYLRTEKAKSSLKTFTPLFSKSEVLQLQKEGLFLWNLLDKGTKLELPSLPSISKIFYMAEKRGILLPQELSSLGLFIRTALRLKDILRDSPFSKIVGLGESLTPLLKELSGIFDFERSEIKDQASYQLFMIRKRIQSLREELISKLDRIKDYYYRMGYLQDNLFLQREGRYVLPVKPEFKNKVKGIVQGFSQSGATVFIEPFSIISLSNSLEELYWEEERELAHILRGITGEVVAKKATFYELEEEISKLDLALAKVILGRVYRGVFPEFIETGSLELEEAFHPLLYLEALERGQDLPIANNFYLKKGLLLTGPNLGGKTVSLKTIGLLVLMALNGFMLPAKGAKVPLFTKVLVDLGDEQNLLEGESSFSAHLKNLKRILSKADEKSLILLDEPGRGTNPEEGNALVCAFIERLLEKGSMIVVTTHSHMLKTFLSGKKDFSFATMEFDPHSHQPTYRLLYGYFGDSHALELAQKLGFDEEILHRAEDFLENKDYFAWQKRYREEIEKIEVLRREWEKKVKELEREREEVAQLKVELREKFDQALKRVYEDWAKEFKKLLEELTFQKSLKKAQEEIQKFLDSKKISLWEEETTFQVGDQVKILPLNREGKIVKIKEKKAEVIAGALRLEVPLAELRKTCVVPSRQTLEKRKDNLSESLFVSQEKISLLGEDVETGLHLLDKKLHECFLKGIKILLVVHGHGTGRLRSAVRDFLAKHPLIERFQAASPAEGGNGATLVFLHKKN